MKIKIAGSYFSFFNNVNIKLSLDSVASSFSFTAKFNPDNVDHRKIFKPLSFQKVEIFNIDDELILTGVIINYGFKSSSSPNLVNISGYSLAGVLEDVNIPVSNYPLESLQRSLRDVSNKLFPLFGINFIVDSSVTKDVDLIYKKTVAEPSETIKSYIAKLASQRNIVLSHNEKGDVVYFRPNTNSNPIYFFNEKNTSEMILSVNGQGIHSELSVIRQPSTDNFDFNETIENEVSDSLGNTESQNSGPELVVKTKSNIVNTYRPSVVILNSGTDTNYDIRESVKNKLAAELKNISVSINLNRIKNLRPGQIVEIQNPDIFLYNKTKFMISSVSFKSKNDNESTDISLVLPETFTGVSPKNIFS